MEQLITPNPNATYSHYDADTNQSYIVQCWPGWCGEFVRTRWDNIPVKYDSAFHSWEGSSTKHEDQNWPELWFPIYFTVAGNVDGHVALHAPDHSIYSSSSSKAKVPVHHSSLAVMQQYWGNGTMLTYLGWTEDIEGVEVIMEENMKPTAGDVQNIVNEIWGIPPDQQTMGYTDQSWHDFIYGILGEGPWINRVAKEQANASQIIADQTTISDLQTQISNLQTQTDPVPVEPTEPILPVITPVIHATAPPINWWKQITNFLKGFFK